MYVFDTFCSFCCFELALFSIVGLIGRENGWMEIGMDINCKYITFLHLPVNVLHRRHLACYVL